MSIAAVCKKDVRTASKGALALFRYLHSEAAACNGALLQDLSDYYLPQATVMSQSLLTAQTTVARATCSYFEAEVYGKFGYACHSPEAS